MTKTKGSMKKPELPKLVDYPKTLYAAVVDQGTDDEYLLTATTPPELHEQGKNFDTRTVKVARYVLAGVGVIHTDTPYYSEDSDRFPS